MQQGSNFKLINQPPTVGAAVFSHCSAHVAQHSVTDILLNTSALLFCGGIIYFNAIIHIDLGEANNKENGKFHK